MMDAFLDVGTTADAHIWSVLDKREDNYTKFHRLRFFDQLRALTAIRTKVFGQLPAINVLDVGVMAVSTMYGEAVPGVNLHTCDHPRRVNNNASHGFADFYPIDLETEDLGAKHPELRGKFHVILFCEVLEHLKMGPKEIMRDFKRLLAPGGMIYLTTPNAMAYTTFLAYFEGRSPVTRFSRQNRQAHLENIVHVREYTVRELAAEVETAGLTIKHRAIKEFFHPDVLWASAFISGRSLITVTCGE